jgi:hypothetical protein
VRKLRPARRPSRAALAFAAGEASILASGRAHVIQAPFQIDQMDEEEWRSCLSALLAASGLRAPRITVALPAVCAPLKSGEESTEHKDWAKTAASDLLPETESVVVSGAAKGGPWWVCAVPRETLTRLLSAAKESKIRIDAVEPAAHSLLRIAPRVPGTVLVAAVAPSGAEIAAGKTGTPLLARSVTARKVADVVAEVELTLRYLEREGTQAVSTVLAGPAAEEVATALKASGFAPAAVVPSGSVAEAVALGVLRRPVRAPDFVAALRGPRFGLPQAVAASAAVLLAISALDAQAQRARADSLRQQTAAARSEVELLQTQLSRWTGPKAQAAAQALRALDARRTPLDPLDHLRTLVPPDLWVERVEMRGASIRVEGRSLSRDSVLSFTEAARRVWSSVTLRLAERDDVPAPSYKFALEAAIPPGRRAP